MNHDNFTKCNYLGKIWIANNAKRQIKFKTIVFLSEYLIKIYCFFFTALIELREEYLLLWEN